MEFTREELENLRVNEIKDVLIKHNIPGRSKPTSKKEYIDLLLKWTSENKKNEDEKFDFLEIPICPLRPDEIFLSQQTETYFLFNYLLTKHRHKIGHMKHLEITFMNDTVNTRNFSNIKDIVKQNQKFCIFSITISYEGWERDKTNLLIFNTVLKKIEFLDLVGTEGPEVYIENLLLYKYNLKKDGWSFCNIQEKSKFSFYSSGCNLWLVKIADLRFHNPKITIKKIVQKLSLRNRKSEDAYIRDFSKFLIKRRSMLYQDLSHQFYIKYDRCATSEEVEKLIIDKFKKNLEKCR